MSLKVNLLLGNPGDIRSGHLNLDATIDAPDGERFPCSVNDFGEMVSPNEAEAVVALDVLDRLPREHAQAVLSYWASRLARGGTLTVSALDVEEFATHVHLQEVPVEELDNAIYKRRSAHTLKSIIEGVQKAGLQVEQAYLDGVRAVVIARRPHGGVS
jgi:trans-aconitate methyltransferase